MEKYNNKHILISVLLLASISTYKHTWVSFLRGLSLLIGKSCIRSMTYLKSRRSRLIWKIGWRYSASWIRYRNAVTWRLGWNQLNTYTMSQQKFPTIKYFKGYFFLLFFLSCNDSMLWDSSKRSIEIQMLILVFNTHCTFKEKIVKIFNISSVY